MRGPVVAAAPDEESAGRVSDPNRLAEHLSLAEPLLKLIVG